MKYLLLVDNVLMTRGFYRELAEKRAAEVEISRGPSGPDEPVNPNENEEG